MMKVKDLFIEKENDVIYIFLGQNLSDPTGKYNAVENIKVQFNIVTMML